MRRKQEASSKMQKSKWAFEFAVENNLADGGGGGSVFD